MLAMKVMSKTLDVTKLAADKIELAVLSRVSGKTSLRILPEKEVTGYITLHEKEEAKAEEEKKKDKDGKASSSK